MINKIIPSLLVFLFIFTGSTAQQAVPSSVIKQKIDKLSTLGTVLYFAAHPDDENTRLIAWLAGEKKYRTAYLSLTRGDGGQNLIGTQQGVELGLIRTQELLAARKLDQGEQYFSAAYDFGFSKTHEETFSFWQKQDILKEAVYVIRKIQPDVIITRFPPDSRGGHGHHQASAILAREAFLAAGDPSRFPEQLKELAPWKATRLVWNTANFGGMNNTSEDQLKIVLDDYNAKLGVSYGEIAANSRSQHKSQGFGAPSSRGFITEYFEHVDGQEAQQNLFDDINTTWARLDDQTEGVEAMIEVIQQTFDVERPASTIPALIELHSMIEELSPGVYRQAKLQEVEDIILQSAGIVLESITKDPNYAVDQEFTVRHEAILRDSSVNVTIKSIDGQPLKKTLCAHQEEHMEATRRFSKTTQPYWLEEEHSLGKYQVSESDFGFPENPDLPSSLFEIAINDKTLSVRRPIEFRYVDPVKGEIHQPISISPKLTAWMNTEKILLTGEDPKTFRIEITNRSDQPQEARLSFEHDDNFSIQIQGETFQIPAHQHITKTFQVTPTTKSDRSGKSVIRPLLNGQSARGLRRISYSHIPNVTWFPPVGLEITTADIQVPLQKVGYIPGAGDLIPSALKSLGIQVEELSGQQVQSTELRSYDAIVLGVRAFNVIDDISSWFPTLLQYAEQGGTVLVQYNVGSHLQSDQLGPFPFTLSADRVTQEDAEVTFTDPNDPILQSPNTITTEDFDGWVQERGLYFASDISPEYRTPLLMNDDQEDPHRGSLLVTKHGKGKFVYTSISFFRQLPAGIPGAYRLFVNLLAKNENN